MSDGAVPQPTRQGSVRERILQLEESIGSPTSAEINRFAASAARAIAHRLSRPPSSDDGLRLALLDLAGSRRPSEAPVTPERFVPSRRVHNFLLEINWKSRERISVHCQKCNNNYLFIYL